MIVGVFAVLFAFPVVIAGAIKIIGSLAASLLTLVGVLCTLKAISEDNNISRKMKELTKKNREDVFNELKLNVPLPYGMSNLDITREEDLHELRRQAEEINKFKIPYLERRIKKLDEKIDSLKKYVMDIKIFCVENAFKIIELYKLYHGNVFKIIEACELYHVQNNNKQRNNY